MNQTIKTIITILAFVIGITLVKLGINAYNEHQLRSTAQHTVENLQVEGKKNHPNEYASEALRQEAVTQASKQLETETDSAKRLQNAAGMFLGFYQLNTRSRPEYCISLGVDINSFVTAFVDEHTKELAKVREILSGQDEDKIYELLGPQFKKLVMQDITDMATAQKTDNKGACTLIQQNGVGLATHMHISKMQPHVYEVLFK